MPFFEYIITRARPVVIITILALCLGITVALRGEIVFKAATEYAKIRTEEARALCVTNVAKAFFKDEKNGTRELNDREMINIMPAIEKACNK